MKTALIAGEFMPIYLKIVCISWFFVKLARGWTIPLLHVVCISFWNNYSKNDFNQKEFNMQTAPDVIAPHEMQIDAYQNVQQHDLNRCNCSTQNDAETILNSSSCA